MFGQLSLKQRLILWLLLGPSAGAIAWRPESMTATKLVGSSLGSLFIISTLLLVWQWRRIRMFAVLLVAAGVAGFVAPGRSFDREALRASYIASLRSYENVPYVWGGEGKRGVDCSGLIRCGLMNACWKRGWLTANPTLIRAAGSIWWNDGSAKAMGDGWKGFTVPIGESRSVNSAKMDRLAPGDMAVAASGLHILVYLGGKQWMQAAPDVGHVAVFDTPSANNWMNEPVKLVRWRLLSE